MKADKPSKVQPRRRIFQSDHARADDGCVEDEAEDRGSRGDDDQCSVAVDEREAEQHDRYCRGDVEQWNGDGCNQRKRQTNRADEPGRRRSGRSTHPRGGPATP